MTFAGDIANSTVVRMSRRYLHAQNSNSDAVDPSRRLGVLPPGSVRVSIMGLPEDWVNSRGRIKDASRKITAMSKVLEGATGYMVTDVFVKRSWRRIGDEEVHVPQAFVTFQPLDPSEEPATLRSVAAKLAGKKMARGSEPLIVEASRLGDKRTAAASGSDCDFAEARLDFENEYTESLAIEGSDRSALWDMALRNDALMARFIMSSATTSVLRRDLPQWFLDKKTPAAEDLEQMGIAPSSVTKAASLFSSWYDATTTHGACGDQKVIRRSGESSMWLEMNAGDKILMTTNEVPVDVDYQIAHERGAGSMTSLALGVRHTSLGTRLGMVDMASWAWLSGWKMSYGRNTLMRWRPSRASKVITSCNSVTNLTYPVMCATRIGNDGWSSTRQWTGSKGNHSRSRCHMAAARKDPALKGAMQVLLPAGQRGRLQLNMVIDSVEDGGDSEASTNFQGGAGVPM